MYRRSMLPHLKNHTNNWLESFFGKLKDGVDGSMSMAACVKALLAYARRKQCEYEYRLSRIGQFVNTNYDGEMSNVFRFTTHFVAEQIEDQYALALEYFDAYTFEEDALDPGTWIVREQAGQFKLRDTNWKCDCEFAQSMSLPCRHAIAFRKQKGVAGPLIPWARIHARWTVPGQQLNQVKQFGYESFGDSSTTALVKAVLTHSERYKEAVRATHLIASELADIEEQQEFEAMLSFVLKQWRNVRQRKMVDASVVDRARTTKTPADVSSFANADMAAIKREFGISSSDSEESENLLEEDSEEEKGPVKIKLNPKSRKVGRPKHVKKRIASAERTDRKWYDKAEAERKAAGENSLDDLLRALDHDQPGLLETQRKLAGVIVKFSAAENKKPKMKRQKNPVLVMDPFFVLPEKLVKACLKLLPLSNTAESALTVDAGSSQTSIHDGATETIQIKDAGNFSRRQIEIFKRVINVKATVQQGIEMHKFLEDGLPSLPAEYHDLASDVAKEVLDTYPYKRIVGLPDLNDFNYSMLYRATPPTWLSDAAIRACCLRLVSDYPSCRFAGFLSAKPRKQRARNNEDNTVNPETRDKILDLVGQGGVTTVFLPLIFSNAYWCCVVIKVDSKRIYYYDPLNQGAYMNAANAICTHLKISGLQYFNVIHQNNPIQFDAYSCGVYVCWMFVRQILAGRPVDMSATALTIRRFELFFYLLTGRLLPVQAAAAAEAKEDGS